MITFQVQKKISFKEKKTVQVIGYLLSLFYKKGFSDVDKLKLIKMVWFADRINIRKNASTITEDSYCAMKLGPVPSFTLDIINKNSVNVSEFAFEYAKNFFEVTNILININTNILSHNFGCLSEEEKSNLNQSFNILFPLESKLISKESHKFPEWKKYEKKLEKTNSSFPINKIDFFDLPVEHVAFNNNEDEETVSLNREIFKDDPLAR